MTNLNDILKHCAKENGLHTFLYARMGEANYLMDSVSQYPVLLRLFNGPISETNIATRRKRKITFYLCDALGESEPNTESKVAPIVDKMENRAFDFINGLRKAGVEVAMVNDITPFMSKFDALVAGVTFSANLTYSVC